MGLLQEFRAVQDTGLGLQGFRISTVRDERFRAETVWDAGPGVQESGFDPFRLRGLRFTALRPAQTSEVQSVGSTGLSL